MEDVKNSYVKEIIKNKKVQLYVEIPDYIAEMIALNKNKKNRKKAEAIYRENNIRGSGSVSHSSSSSMANGKTSNTNSCSISISLTVESPMIIRMPEQKFVYNGRRYTLQSFTLEL